MLEMREAELPGKGIRQASLGGFQFLGKIVGLFLISVPGGAAIMTKFRWVQILQIFGFKARENFARDISVRRLAGIKSGVVSLPVPTPRNVRSYLNAFDDLFGLEITEIDGIGCFGPLLFVLSPPAKVSIFILGSVSAIRKPRERGSNDHGIERVMPEIAPVFLRGLLARFLLLLRRHGIPLLAGSQGM